MSWSLLEKLFLIFRRKRQKESIKNEFLPNGAQRGKSAVKTNIPFLWKNKTISNTFIIQFWKLSNTRIPHSSKFNCTYQRRIKSRAFNSYAGIRVLVGGRVRGAINPDAGVSVLQRCQPGRIVLARTHALTGDGVGHQRSPRFTTLRRAGRRGASGR